MDDERFAREDLEVLAALRSGNAWMRALLATLARRGIAFRQRHPHRAHAWLDVLSTFPYYKAGQFLFDLMEWEDFVLDEPAGTLPHALDSGALQRLSAALAALRAHLDGSVDLEPPAPPAPIIVVHGAGPEHPALEAGFYLYQDVVLGILDSVLPLIAMIPPAE